MPSVPKIIIKPRLIAPPPHQLSNSSAPTPSSRTDDADSEDNENPDEDENVSNNGDDSQSIMEIDGASQNAATPGGTIDGGGDSRLGTPTPKGRGRPRGRTKGTGSSTPVRPTRATRARGRGRGRGKAAGGLTIKLPKRENDEGDAATEDGAPEPEEPEVKEETPMEPEAEEGPIGGGKPFRRIQGKVYVIDGDEFVTDEDSKGDQKIDRWGNLLGGRRFKASTFLLPNRHPERKYMLAIDAARTSGFRDSLYYFRRNVLALKLNATQPEKDYLISEGKLGSHLRTRSVTLVTARSAFKLHGSKTVIDGRWVVDDYYEEKVLEEITAKGLKPGDPVGELPDPNATHHSNELSSLAGGAGAAGKGEKGSSGGIYRAGGPTTIFGGSGLGPYSDGPLNAVRKSLLSRDGVTEENWMYMMATRVHEAGEEWSRCRRGVLKPYPGIDGVGGTDGTQSMQIFGGVDWSRGKEVEEEGEEDEKQKTSEKKRKISYNKDEPALGLYEPHTGMLLYRADTQPTRCRWEVLPESDTKRRVLGGTKAGNGAWALAWVDAVMELPNGVEQDPAAEARQKLVQEVESSIDLTQD